jgi:hypothetical protein
MEFSQVVPSLRSRKSGDREFRVHTSEKLWKLIFL